MTAEKLPPRLVSSREIYKGRVITLRLDEIEVAGRVFKREVVEHPGAVVIVPVDAAGNVLWVRQHRHAAGRSLLELPAGTLEAGEAPDLTAQRELAEETGFAAETWLRLGGFYSAPGFCAEYLHAYAATGLSPQAADGDEDEDIELVPISIADSLARLDAGEIEDAKSIAAFLLYMRKR